jgi:hypothetical protein
VTETDEPALLSIAVAPKIPAEAEACSPRKPMPPLRNSSVALPEPAVDDRDG